MIDDIFVKSAIRIRREYLKTNNSLDTYRKKAVEVTNNLDDIIKQLEAVQEKATRKEFESGLLLQEIQKILDNIEEEGKRLETIIEPLNKRLEKLSIEEQELWRNIKQKHSDIPDEKIVEFVTNKLISEGLS
jgi:hypothetical protein